MTSLKNRASTSETSADIFPARSREAIIIQWMAQALDFIKIDALVL